MTSNRSHEQWWRQTTRATLGTAVGAVAVAVAALIAAQYEIGTRVLEIPLSLASLTILLPLALSGLLIVHGRRQEKIDRRNDIPEG